MDEVLPQGKDIVGLNTKDAINKLHADILQVVAQFKAIQCSRKAKKSWITDTLHHCSQHTNINWISSTFLLLSSFVLLLTYIITNEQPIHILEAAIVLILLTINLSMELYDNYKRFDEVAARVRSLLEVIKSQVNHIHWLPEHYPHLCTPFSPCITLQWTYRDNKIINLPWALLVKDDIILMRPGQISPGYCECVEKNAEYPLLHAKEVYGPALQKGKEIFSAPKARKPLSTKKYKLLETPYLNNLRVSLEQNLDRPVTQHNQQRHLVLIRVIERIFLPTTFLLILVINFVRYTYFENYMNKPTTDLFLVVPVATILPLLPITFPIAWNILNYLGMAKFKILFDVTTTVNYNTSDHYDDHDIKIESFPRVEYNWKVTLKNVMSILKGDEHAMTRTANILHVLGSVTALCCIDKKGILSWPNPTAEKVFFLHNSDNLSESSSLANLGDLHTDGDSVKDTNTDVTAEEVTTAVAEVLDVTYNHAEPFKLHFDDTKWHKHLNSLKPLGLAILLNTCNVETQEHYTEFCSHITCEAMYNENVIPVTNRRCLCELAKEIGFVDEARKIFALEQNLSSFRHLQPEMVRRDNKYARSLSMSTKLKFPFPHMFAVVVKELSSGAIQLLSQGTADIVLDSCVDYWDGVDLCPLTVADRKKIQDFYQRSSLTAYCSAFAYRPLSKGVSDKLSQVYLELPSDSRHLYHSQRSPTPIHWDTRSVLEPKIKTPLGQFYSTDSLLYNDSPCSDVSDTESCFEMQCNQVFIGMVTMQYQAQADMVHLIEQLERACIRFVHFSKENELRSRVFSEKMGLESGWNCHISLLSDRNRAAIGTTVWANNGTVRVLPRRKSQSERRLYYAHPYAYSNARRSRDKYGACAAAPPSQSNLASSRTMSFSAPSAINMEHPVVKFDNELQPLMKSDKTNLDENQSTVDDTTETNDNRTSQESLHQQQTTTVDLSNHPHDWQSLSCLTDSTEQSAPINFDMSNRAKLPRGIDKIRPHIELIDNVPLLVSLFTDCTPAGSREMLQIMQDYGEVVCVLGSSANYENAGIFMQADAGIAVEPLYPQVCQKRESFQPLDAICNYFSPIDLSRQLNAIPCSLSLKREDPISLIHLVAEARHYISSLWNIVQFWICCCITVSIVQLIASFLMLPALLTPGQVIWIICVIIPLLSISLIGTRTDHDIMKRPQGKNQLNFSVEISRFVLWCYGSKFLPVIFIVIGSFGGYLALYCVDICWDNKCDCLLFYLPMEPTNSTLIDGWTNSEHSNTLHYIQHLIVVLIYVQFVTVSISFVHREYNIWNRSPHTNYFWIVINIILVVLQTIYTSININITEEKNVRIPVIIFISISPLITFGVCELVKKEEIRVNLRHQRRARLDFGTKLGMNSPF